MKTNKYFRTLLVVLCAAALFVSGCGEKTSAPLEKMTLAVPTHLAATPAYIAFSKDFFRENGLEVTLQKHSAGKFCLDAVLEGKADMAVMADFPFMNAVMNGREVGIVATIATTEGHLGIAARKDRGISGPEDLRGKRIGVTFGTNQVYFLHMFLASRGIGNEEIKTVNLRPEQMADALKKDEVDAVCTQRQILKKAQKELGDRVELFSSRLYLETYNMAGTKDFVKKRPETMKRLLRALLKAEEFIRKKPEESKEIMSMGIDIDKSAISEMWSSYRFDITLNHYLLNILEAQSRWLIKSRLTDRKKVPNYLDNVYPEELKAVRPEAVSLRSTKEGK